jgi:hypothetical protein
MTSPLITRRPVEALAPACILLSAASLAAGYLQGGAVWFTLLAGAVAATWLLAQWRGWRWADALGLAGNAILAALGVTRGLSIGWMLGGLTAALAAWDLAAFTHWLRAVELPAQTWRLMLHHLGRLLIVLAVGLLLAALALQAQLWLPLPVLLLLGLVLVLGISQALRFLKRQPG